LGRTARHGAGGFDTTRYGPATILLGIGKAARGAGDAVSIAPERVVRAGTAARRILANLTAIARK
jgi:hypothetical protein